MTITEVEADRAAQQERVAAYFCRKGNHFQACYHWLVAAECWRRALDHVAAAYCTGQAQAEANLVDPGRSIDVTALVA